MQFGCLFIVLHSVDIRVSAAYLRQWTYGSCRLGLYSYFLEKITKDLQPGDQVSFMQKLGMGCVSGGVGSFVGNPAELAMVRTLVM
jgi:solute carrier family 25 (mitochondrial oxoglutarate transporter), member 11